MEDQGLITIYLVFFIFWIIFAPVALVLIFICYVKNNHDMDYVLFSIFIFSFFQLIYFFGNKEFDILLFGCFVPSHRIGIVCYSLLHLCW